MGQAKKVAAHLKNEKIDFIYSSDLRRAKDTAKEIAKYHKVKIFYTKELSERANKFIEKIYKKHKGRNVLVVSHGNFIKMLLGIALGSHVKYAIRRKLS